MTSEKKKGLKNIIKTVIVLIVVLIIAWCVMFFSDLSKVKRGSAPIFCTERSQTQTSADYAGAGYSCHLVQNPVTGKTEYSMSIFGQLVSSNITE